MKRFVLAALALAGLALSYPYVGDPDGTADAAAIPPHRANVVLVLMDDFSMDLLQTMQVAQKMADRGATYPHSHVVDSLCCVSRTSLLTGQYPHQTGVQTNTANLPNDHGPVGGWPAFAQYGNAERSVNVRLQKAGYQTGYVGKFLNEYREWSPEPAGWDEWRAIFPDAYDGWNFLIREADGSLGFRAAPPASATAQEKDARYATTVTSDIALDFIRRHEKGPAPYFLQVSTYGPHARVGGAPAYPDDPLNPPAFRDRPGPGQRFGNCGAVRCQDLTVDDLPGWGDPRRDNRPRWADGSKAPAWRTNRVRLTERQAEISLRDRARMVQSIDRMLGRILESVGPQTYVILTSDNGFHLGQHGLERGKATPYDSDSRVPLVVVGPGVERGERDDMVANIDLAPTLEELAGLRPAPYRFGTSFAPTLWDREVVRRDHVFFEHTWAPSLGGDDPDRWYAGGTIDLIPSYVAVRSRTGLLVRFDLDPSWTGTRYAWEFYDYRDAPFEQTNTFGRRTSRAQVAELRGVLRDFLACGKATRDDPVSRDCRRVGMR